MCSLTTMYLHLTNKHLGATSGRLNALALEKRLFRGTLRPNE